ncbi:MAG: Gfo/Idh/MocA family oxidoreductase [Planctomycetota bacterium]|nr:Gfo/Idh/MocA family oxidoreductase [Planctomycetota bacterium]
MLNLGIIGLGTVSGYGHLPAASSSPHWRLAAIADVNPQRLAQVARDHPAAAPYADFRALLAHPGLDAVAVATHADTHCEITLAALARGLHVLCEKPMAGSLEQCQSMVDAAGRADRILAVNFNGRSALIYRRIKQLIDQGTVGPIRVVRIVYDWSAHQWQPLERMENFMRNGGPVVDSAVHFFEAIRWYTGQDVEHIDAQGVVLPPYEHPQHVIATCKLSGGAIALVEAGWLYTNRSKDQGQLYQIDVIGDDGAISYDIHSNSLRAFGKSSTLIEPFEDSDKNFPYIYERFAHSIAQGKLVDLASGLDGLKATDAAYRALASTKRHK